MVAEYILQQYTYMSCHFRMPRWWQSTYYNNILIYHLILEGTMAVDNVLQ